MPTVRYPTERHPAARTYAQRPPAAEGWFQDSGGYRCWSGRINGLPAFVCCAPCDATWYAEVRLNDHIVPQGVGRSPVAALAAALFDAGQLREQIGI